MFLHEIAPNKHKSTNFEKDVYEKIPPNEHTNDYDFLTDVIAYKKSISSK